MIIYVYFLFSDNRKDEKEKAETESQEKLEKKETKEEDIMQEDVTFNINIILPSGDSFKIPVG